MPIGLSLILIAAGAVLVWGVTGEVSGLDVDAIGVILMVVGAIGFVISMIFWSSWSPYHRRTAYVEGDVDRVPSRRRRQVVVDEDAPPRPPPL